MREKNTDGFVAGNSQIGQPSSRGRGRQNPSLDGFERRSDGFHPMRQSPGGLGHSAEDAEREALLDEPIILDDMDYHQPKKRHHTHRRFPRLRKIVRRSALVAGIALVATLSILGYKFYITQRQVLSGGGHAPAVCNGNVPLSALKKEGDGRVNTLLLGIGGPGHQGPYATDTLMLASLDPINNKVDLLSIPRDLWVRIPGNGQQRINAAYLYGRESSKSKDNDQINKDAVDLVDKTLESVLGITVHYHILVDFKAFESLINALGGVDVNVSKELTVYERLWVEGTNRHYNLNVGEGHQHFDGERALYYARSRQTSPRGDFDRAERQRLLLVATKDKALSLGTFSNPVKISSLLDSLGENVYTDFDTGSLKCMYKQFSEVDSEKITSKDLTTPPNDLLTTANLGGASIVRPKAGLFAYDELQAHMRKTFRDGFLAKENAPIAVYNATKTPGVATKTAEMLKNYGYRVTAVENAPNQTNPAASTLVDLSKGKNKYTRHYLQNRLSLVAQSQLPDGLGVTPPEGTAFVIILGNAALSD